MCLWVGGKGGKSECVTRMGGMYLFLWLVVVCVFMFLMLLLDPLNVLE